MAETFAKKEKEKKRAKKRLDKEEKKEKRKADNDKGKSLEEMTVYLDVNGNITDVHPDKQKPLKNRHTGMNDLNTSNEVTDYTGIVSLFFTDKGYGFITEDNTRASIFVHVNKLTHAIKEKDRVIFSKEKTAKGEHAVNVRKI